VTFLKLKKIPWLLMLFHFSLARKEIFRKNFLYNWTAEIFWNIHAHVQQVIYIQKCSHSPEKLLYFLSRPLPSVKSPTCPFIFTCRSVPLSGIKAELYIEWPNKMLSTLKLHVIYLLSQWKHFKFFTCLWYFKIKSRTWFTSRNAMINSKLILNLGNPGK